jgi:hypothetical protein
MMVWRSATVILPSFILNHSVDSVDILDSASPTLVDTGNHIPMDKSLPGDYLKVASDQGHDDAQENYGMVVDTGNDIAMDKSFAADYLKVAGDQRHDDAQANYGIVLDTGNGIRMANLNKVVSSPMPIIILSIRIVRSVMEAIL